MEASDPRRSLSVASLLLSKSIAFWVLNCANGSSYTALFSGMGDDGPSMMAQIVSQIYAVS